MPPANEFAHSIDAAAPSLGDSLSCNARDGMDLSGDAAFVWGGAEKHAQLLNDVCVHKVLFRDEPAEAGNRLAADTLMVLQDLATSRVQLSEDVETVALAACAAFSAQLNHLNALDEACQKLHAASPPPTKRRVWASSAATLSAPGLSFE